MSHYQEEEYLQLSGLQHFAFCRRQWGLIHLEGQWQENLLTTQGQILHQNAHNDGFAEKRGDLLVVRGLRISSAVLGVTGACDVVELRASPEGVPLRGREGLWLPTPVEYKRGRPKATDADRLQLCAQGICLEEMLACPVPAGYLYYGETRRREEVPFTDALRSQVAELLAEMHQYHRRGHTPSAKPGKGCGSCSLRELCLPRLCSRRSPGAYIRSHLEEGGPEG